MSVDERRRTVTRTPTRAREPLPALAITGIGVCASGMLDWPTARAVLCSEVDHVPLPLPKFDIPALPVTERRRVNATSRLAINAATEATVGLPDTMLAGLASVFASADGDGPVLASMLDALAQPAVTLSPTLFHNSVFNAPAGYWTIASGACVASTTVAAGAGTFAAGLLEAGSQVVASGNPVLYVAFDMPFPHSLSAFAVGGDAFACALLLAPAGQSAGAPWGTISRWARLAAAPAPEGTPTMLAAHFAGNAAAASLPLLEAIARRVPTAVTVPFLDGVCLELAYAP